MGCELRVFEASNKIKACLMTAKGMIGVVLQVYSSDGAGSPSMVEVRVFWECAYLLSRVLFPLFVSVLCLTSLKNSDIKCGT